ncbi:MAG: UDP-N-acetylglucosamine 1-carboxyvinyltransferase [Ruminococcaceae bacterium]|nr:UDP-N-acetylglucosamine 1-carboxyvinyltransferase [Oscillospiraceae bacterium]
MNTFVIQGGKPLCGTVAVTGSKNAALPILASSLLSGDKVLLKEIPALTDVKIMCEILSVLGCRMDQKNVNEVIVDTRKLNHCIVPYELAGLLRGSILVMGPLLARLGQVQIAMPGGCPIGARPVDLHIKGFAALGASITTAEGCIIATAKKLHGAKIYLDFPSVGATENIMSAAVLAQGDTIIENAAVEPEVVDLANFLCSMGAKISGAGTDTIKITGVTSLHGTQYTIMPDRIEAGTLLVAAAATGGCVTVTNILPEYSKPMTAKLLEMNVPITMGENTISIHGGGALQAVDVKTLPFPGFPTDMQAPMTALLSIARGIALVTETIFENRFMHVAELCRMGASIKVAGRCAMIEGCNHLTGAKVTATDLRAGAALVIAGLAARGDTEISDIHHIDRGYAALEKKLQQLGADIRRK